jgi:hypothetical protein
MLPLNFADRVWIAPVLLRTIKTISGARVRHIDLIFQTDLDTQFITTMNPVFDELME